MSEAADDQRWLKVNFPDSASVLLVQGRPVVLTRLKELGILNLSERQRLASAVAKHLRACSLPSRAERTPQSNAPPMDPNNYASPAQHWFEWMPEGWRSRCAGGALASEVGWPTGVIHVIDGVLSRNECARLVARAEEAGFAFSEHQGRRDEGFRRGRRALLTDGGLAAELFARLSHILPALDTTPLALVRVQGVMAEGITACAPLGATTRAVGVWEQLRVLSYDAADFFRAHRDNACGEGDSKLLPHCRSHCSLLLYLADSDDGGGATRFYREDGLQGPDACTAVADVVPWAGRAVVFPHRVLHASMPITSGRKYVIRGDVLWPV